MNAAASEKQPIDHARLVDIWGSVLERARPLVTRKEQREQKKQTG